MGVQLSWQSTCPASRGSSVRTRLPPPPRMGSQRSWLEHTPDKREVDGPSPFEPTKRAQPDKTYLLIGQQRRLTTAQQISQKVFIFLQKKIKTSTKRQKKFSKKVKLIWLISKNVKSNFKALDANEISRVKNLEFFQQRRRVEREKERSSYKGLTEDALVHGAEEGRDKLRKATVRSKYPKSRGYPNEGTQHE